jgi:flagellar protein FliO/FliZ
MGTAGVALRMVASLAAVLLLLFVVARFARRGRPRGNGPDMTVVSRCTVGSKASVAVVRLGDRALVVGVTEQSVTLLSESPLDQFAELADPADGPESSQTRMASDVVVRRKVVVDPSSRPAATEGKLAGSALAPDTWRRTMDAVRDLTVRR